MKVMKLVDKATSFVRKIENGTELCLHALVKQYNLLIYMFILINNLKRSTAFIYIFGKINCKEYLILK